MAFKIGQQVVCKTNITTGAGIPFGLIKGKVYTILNIEYCNLCNAEFLIIDSEMTQAQGRVCGKCGDTIWNPNAFHSWRFEPVKYDLIDNKEAIGEIIEERIDVKIKQPLEI